MKAFRSSILILLCCCSIGVFSQDSLSTRLLGDTNAITIDTNRIRKHSPRVATKRSLILPGWGQAYNREYWKIPIVWGALGTAAGFWIHNNTWYKRTRFAFTLVVDTNTARYGEIHPKLISERTGKPLDAQSLQFYRNQFRKNRDYSLLYFFALWALNVADATVFAHLKEFDVSDDLSLRVMPDFDPVKKSTGFSLSLNVKKPLKKKNYFDTR
jgi:hypothetical protein